MSFGNLDLALTQQFGLGPSHHFYLILFHQEFDARRKLVRDLARTLDHAFKIEGEVFDMKAEFIGMF